VGGCFSPVRTTQVLNVEKNNFRRPKFDDRTSMTEIRRPNFDDQTSTVISIPVDLT